MELFSPFHIIVIAAVVIILFGGRKIPEVMRGMGEGIRSFKEGMRGDGTAASPATAGAPSTPSVNFSVSPNPVPAGQPVTLTAAISPAPTGASLGTVSFFNGPTLLGTASVNASGVGSFSSASIPTGSLNLTAVYSGSANLTAATSAAVALSVNSPMAMPTGQPHGAS